MKLTLLGCGTSSGVPRIGNDWGRCDPSESRNRRTRCAALVESSGTRVLIDTGPDMREQLNAANVGRVDAVIWTHDHADHTHGIDDLRQLAQSLGRPVPCYARPATAAVLAARFTYVFEGGGGYRPVATLAPLPDELTIGDVTISTVDQPHGEITSAGLIFAHHGKRIAYSTDFHALTDEMTQAFDSAEIWILDALRRHPHPSHNHLSLALEHIERVRPGRAVLIHMDNSMDYRTLNAELPTGVELGYDGMVLLP
ncbi:MBL fold metallo-hydrolase [Sphingomonas spermidinifaciens]|uniref:MBL fold metallo-hydrolase n=1 Tax=Sphingomonas spermidinifaciens TaxID=1141889 RepID=A0A2A4B5W3_9SPHN|nr:MBL fold metallo-hydrolase [Sphingomonas spermidinifaciens]PCD03034.1 MBL fold metallo-hydrolase [Sphingomonas spermidinifaciens]